MVMCRMFLRYLAQCSKNRGIQGVSQKSSSVLSCHIHVFEIFGEQFSSSETDLCKQFYRSSRISDMLMTLFILSYHKMDRFEHFG